MKTDIHHAAWSPYLIVGFIAILAGAYWKLRWFMALPVITLLFPALIAAVLHYLFSDKSFGQKIRIYGSSNILCERGWS